MQCWYFILPGSTLLKKSPFWAGMAVIIDLLSPFSDGLLALLGTSAFIEPRLEAESDAAEGANMGGESILIKASIWSAE